jgi:hypothetical protein
VTSGRSAAAAAVVVVAAAVAAAAAAAAAVGAAAGPVRLAFAFVPCNVLVVVALRGSEADRLGLSLPLRVCLRLSLAACIAVARNVRLLSHYTRRFRILALSLCRQVLVQRRVHVCSHVHVSEGWSEGPLRLLREWRAGLRDLGLRLRLGLPLLRLHS